MRVGESIGATIVVGLTAVVLLLAGVNIDGGGPNYLGKLAGFAIFCLVLFHLMLWAMRRNNTERALKVLDYVYFGFGFLGLFSVLDLQVEAYRREVPEVLHQMKAENLYDLRACGVTVKEPLPECGIESRLLKAVSPRTYNHKELGSALQAYVNSGLYRISEFEPLYERAKQVYAEVDKQVYQYLDEIDRFNPLRKIGAFVVICIAVSIRIAKLSAELFGWHLPRDAPEKVIDPKPSAARGSGRRS
jgi:hypothetical protein